MEYSVAFVALAAYAERKGVSKLNELPGLWDTEINSDWRVKLNAHDHDIDGVPPYHALAEYRGTPALLMSPQGGICLVGRDGSRAEDDFIAAVKAA